MKVDSREPSTLAAREGVPALVSEATQRRRRGALFAALGASLVVHLSLVLWPLTVTRVEEEASLSPLIAELRAQQQANVVPIRSESSAQSPSSVARPQPREAEQLAAERLSAAQAAATIPAASSADAVPKSAPTPQNASAQASAERPGTPQDSAKGPPSVIDGQPGPVTTSSEVSASDRDGAAVNVAEASPEKEPSNPIPLIAGSAPAPAVADTWSAFMPSDNTTAEPTRFDPPAAVKPLEATSPTSADMLVPLQSTQVSSGAPVASEVSAARLPETLSQLQSQVAVDAAPSTSAKTPRPFTGFIVHLRPGSSLSDLFADATMKELPLRIDLGYKVFLGTNGLLIGDGTYSFEHTGDTYRIVSIARPRGLAASLVPGRGRAESRGVITSRGLQPREFSIERGSPDKREIADFDWNTGTVALYGDKLEPFDVQTSDPMALLWQFYFAPPAGNEFTFSVATTRRVYRYTIKREGREKIAWGNRIVNTEVWRRRSDDGSADVYAWLAPSLNYVPIKLRINVAPLGVVEALLDTMRVDDAPPR